MNKVSMLTRALLLILSAATLSAATDLKPVLPAKGAKPIGPYTPGIAAGDYVYVSGQGARDAAGNLPAGIEAQTRQCLQNVQDILQASGLTFDNVVWSQVFLADIKEHDAMNKVYASFFPKNAPARSVVGVTRMPAETPVEIAVVAVRNPAQKKTILVGSATDPVSNAVQVGDRVYVSGVLGIDPKRAVPAQPREQVKALVGQMRGVLGKAGLEFRNMAYAHVYVDAAMPIKVLRDLLNEIFPSETAVTVVQTKSLPHGAHVEISGIASRQAKRTGDCTVIGDTVYCAAVAGTIEQALQRVQANMKINGAGTERVVATNVFLDDIDNFAAMNKVYAGAFAKWHPTRVTVQPTAKAEELNLAPSTNSPPPVANSPRVQLTVIAVR